MREMREVIVNDATWPGRWTALYDIGERASLTAQSGEAYVWIHLDRAGAAEIRDWLDAWLAKEGTE